MIYLDGAHTFLFTGLGCCLAKELLSTGGYLILDDIYWTQAGSPTVSPKVRSQTADEYTNEQIRTPQVEMVMKIFLETDPNFERILLNEKEKPLREVFRKIR